MVNQVFSDGEVSSKRGVDQGRVSMRIVRVDVYRHWDRILRDLTHPPSRHLWFEPRKHLFDAADAALARRFQQLRIQFAVATLFMEHGPYAEGSKTVDE
ncbi:hypothetical protein Neosp_012354 [[Neocosmospora] mangrovei]